MAKYLASADYPAARVVDIDQRITLNERRGDLSSYSSGVCQPKLSKYGTERGALAGIHGQHTCLRAKDLGLQG